MTGDRPGRTLPKPCAFRMADCTESINSAVNFVRILCGANAVKYPLGLPSHRATLGFSKDGVATLFIATPHPCTNTHAHYYVALMVRLFLLNGGIPEGGLISCEESVAAKSFLYGHTLGTPFQKGNGGAVALASTPEAKERARAAQIQKGTSKINGFGKSLSEEALRNCRKDMVRGLPPQGVGQVLRCDLALPAAAAARSRCVFPSRRKRQQEEAHDAAVACENSCRSLSLAVSARRSCPVEGTLDGEAEAGGPDLRCQNSTRRV